MVHLRGKEEDIREHIQCVRIQKGFPTVGIQAEGEFSYHIKTCCERLPKMTNLSTKLATLEAAGKPIQVGIIGAGKFGSM